MSEISFDDFMKVDIRVGRVNSAVPLEKARRPAYRLKIDFGPEIGMKNSSAQITEAYTAEELEGKLILAVVNFPPKRIAGFKSEVLTLGVYSGGGGGPVILVSPDDSEHLKPGDRLG